MGKIGLGFVMALWFLGACSSAGSDGASDGGGAAAARQEMDALAEELLPDLVGALGGELSGMEADFVERGGFGLWDYRARGQLVRPSPRPQSLPDVRRVLEDHGLAVQAPGTTADVTATAGNVRVSVSWTSGGAVDTADLTMTTLEPASGDDEYASESAPTDYSAFLR